MLTNWETSSEHNQGGAPKLERIDESEARHGRLFLTKLVDDTRKYSELCSRASITGEKNHKLKLVIFFMQFPTPNF